MEIRNLGQSGLRVSAIGLGCNNFGGRIDDEATRAVIHKALDLGITLFDTADTYGERGGSETVMGQVLGDDRKRIVLATKFGNADGRCRREGRRRAPLHHAPRSRTVCAACAPTGSTCIRSTSPIPRTPIEETLRALDDLVRQGQGALHRLLQLPRLAGGDRGAMDRAANNLNAFVSCQDEYSLVFPRHVRAATRRRAAGMGMLPFFPLASGLLTGKYRRNAADAGGHAAGQHAAPGRPLSDRAATGRSPKSSATSPKRAATRCWNWRSVLAAGAGPGDQRDRRRDAAGTTGAERQGRRLEAVGGGTGRGRSHHSRVTTAASRLAGRQRPAWQHEPASRQ
jgi:aryl-alcohol dehydrogenase-like predicted oxidoreductase